MTARITELHQPPRGWRYHSGTALYAERLRDGRLIAASLQDTGVPCSAVDEETAVPAFDLQLDGESLAFGWELAGAAVTGAGNDRRLEYRRPAAERPVPGLRLRPPQGTALRPVGGNRKRRQGLEAGSGTPGLVHLALRTTGRARA